MFMYLTSFIYENFGQTDMMKKSLTVNTASVTTLRPIGIVPLILDIYDHTFVHKFIMCMNLKQ